MSKSSGGFMRLMRFSYLLFALCAIAMAQQGPSPLVGKTIRVYNPEPGGVLNVDMSGTGYPMTAIPGTNWMTYTVPATIQFHVTKFGVRNDYGQGNFWISRTGVQATGADAFTDADFAGKDTLWIIVDPAGPPTAPPVWITEAPKIINVFNPWPTTAPRLAFAGGTKKGMLTVAGNCGWFWAFLMKPAEHSFFLEEVNGADSYGSGGLGNQTPYNLAPEFASKGSTLWLDTDINAWLATDPKKNRPCGYQMAATVRDFSDAHVDFDFGQAPDAVVTGMVEAVLPANKKPVRTAKTHQHFNKFEEWFNTIPGTNAETCVDIPMTQTGDGMWMYDSYTTPEHGYWPIDNFTNPNNQMVKPSCYVKPDGVSWVNPQPPHNMNFCLESHATFIYQKGQKFEFRGDDDVWVYIDNKLQIDLGGLHTPKADTIDLDQLNLTAGKTYNWDFYYCERQPCGSSLKVKTSIYFKQQRALEAVPDPAKPGTYKIVKFSGGSGACGSLGTEVKEVPVPAGSLIYKLWNASGNEVESLGEGSFQNGGIVIATPSVVVDTAKITALPPGNYRVVAFEPASPTIKAEVPFTIANRSWVQFVPKEATAMAGIRIPVVAANQIGAAAPTGVMGYTFTVTPPTGLQIFADSAGTVPVTTSGSTGADGLDTLWVGVDTEIPSAQSFTLATLGSTRQVKVTFTPRPLDLPMVKTATIHDEDANGIADRIVAVYDRDISALLPNLVAFQWPASAAQVQIQGTSLAGMVATTTLTLPIRPLDSTVLTTGTGWFHSRYPARGGRDSTQTVPLVERIAPVLRTAEMLGDTLRLTFSEPVKTAGLAAPAELFVYRLNQAGSDLSYAPTEIRWNAARDGADLIFPAGSTEAPRSGNLVRIKEGANGIADDAGNGVGPNSRFRLITGTKKAAIATVTYIKVDPTKLAANPAPLAVTLEGTNAKVEDVVERTGRLGHLIKVDLGDHAQADDFNPVDPAKVSLEYHVSYFTNHGTPIASEKRTVSCLDPEIFKGDCRSNRGYLFVGWNYNTLKAQRVGTGAYIARLRYKVVAGGKTPVAGDLDQVWGVLRTN
jgi:fibro-slime domain-containing protein